jgi:hypothetical protein
MKKVEAMQRIFEAMNQALEDSDAFKDACAHLNEAGLERRIQIDLYIFERETVAAPAAITDDDFLRDLHIVPDVEARDEAAPRYERTPPVPERPYLQPDSITWYLLKQLAQACGLRRGR